jgi:PAS domain S-box-containing protein
MSPGKRSSKPQEQLLRENEELRIQLAEAQETLRAIREGEVDAVIVSGSQGEQVFSLFGTESIYRLIVETMKEAAFTVTFDGKILYCNAQFGEFIKRPMEHILGHSLQDFVDPANCSAADSLLVVAQKQPVKQRLVFADAEGRSVPAHISANILNQSDGLNICVVATDLTELENSTVLIQQLRSQQEALHESEERLRFALEASEMGHWDLNLVDHSSHRSLRHDQIFGYDELLPEWTFEMFLEHVVPEDQNLVEQSYLRAIEEQHDWDFECRIVRRDKSLRWIWACGRLHSYEAGKPTRLAGIVQDITERKQAEALLIQNQKTFYELVERAPFGIYVIDSQFRIAQMNAGSQTGAFRNVQPVIGRDFAEVMRILWPEPVAVGIISSFRHTLETGEPYYSPRFFNPRHDVEAVEGYEWELHRIALPDGQFGVICYYFDSTKLRQAEETLRANEERLRLALDAARLATWDWDMVSGNVIWNDLHCRILGYEPGAIRPTYNAWIDRVHPDDRTAAEAKLRHCMEQGGDYVNHFRTLWPDGTVRFLDALGRFERDSSGKAIRNYGAMLDVTESKQAEAVLRRLNESLEQRVAERTAEIERKANELRALAAELTRAEQKERQRLAKILHDHIQQLLVAARMQVEWLKRDTNAERVSATAQGIDSILREALDASRSLTVELSPPVLHQLGLIGGLNWLVSRMQEKNQFKVNLSSDTKAEPAKEETRYLLYECVRELLFNALKHSGIKEAYVTLLRGNDHRIKLVVKDEGKGFDPNLLIGPRSENATLGLFSIQQRLAHIGGEMEIVTAPDKGTSITVTLPAAETQESLEGTGTATQQERTGKIYIHDRRMAYRVLIVDDHKIVREGLVGLMQFESDIEVVGQAADGPQAIELAEQLQPDVIIMDINLGEMSGVEATRRILAKRPVIKVIGLSMHTDNDLANAMRDAGAITYLSKGGPVEDLIAAIRAACTDGFAGWTSASI